MMPDRVKFIRMTTRSCDIMKNDARSCDVTRDESTACDIVRDGASACDITSYISACDVMRVVIRT